MKRRTGLVGVGVLSVLALAAAGAGAGRGNACGCVMDPRVYEAVMDSARTLTGSARAEVYGALARNHALDTESRLRLIREAQSLTGDARRDVLLAMAGGGRCR